MVSRIAQIERVSSAHVAAAFKIRNKEYKTQQVRKSVRPTTVKNMRLLCRGPLELYDRARGNGSTVN